MHHVCLISDQLVPNLLPLKAKDDCLKPDKVTLVVSEAMRKNGVAERFRRIVAELQILVEEDIFLPDANDMQAMQEILTNWVLEHGEEDLLLNVTGGTKLMAIVAQQVFQAMEKRIIYVDIVTDRVLWVDDPKRDPIKLTSQLHVKQLLKLYGLEITEGEFVSRVRKEKWRQFAKTLADNPQWHKDMGAVNAFAAEWRGLIKDKKKSFFEARKIMAGKSQKDINSDLMIALYKNELVSDYIHLDFPDQEALEFCNGAWLEHYVFEQLKSLKLGRNDALMNVKVDLKKSARNEFDCVVSVNNSLYVIECKTKNMMRDNSADDAIYKLAQLAEKSGGLRGKGILVSYRPVRPEDCERARAYGVRIIDDLSRLQMSLKMILQR